MSLETFSSRAPSLPLAVHLDQPLHDQLAQHPERGARVTTACAQRVVGLLHAGPPGNTGRQEQQVSLVAAMQALIETRVRGPVNKGRGGIAGGFRIRDRHGSRSATLRT